MGIEVPIIEGSLALARTVAPEATAAATHWGKAALTEVLEQGASIQPLRKAAKLVEDAIDALGRDYPARWRELRAKGFGWGQTEPGLLKDISSAWTIPPLHLPVSAEQISLGSEQFVRELLVHRPQIVDGRPQYMLTGSLSTNLLERAGQYTRIDSRFLPQKIAATETLTFGENGRMALSKSVRQVNDVDIIEFPREGVHSGDWLGPAFNEISDASKTVFQRVSLGSRVRFDVHSESEFGAAASIRLGDMRVLIQNPESNYAWKLKLADHLYDRPAGIKYETDASLLRKAIDDQHLAF